jgi:hypothetical protein
MQGRCGRPPHWIYSRNVIAVDHVITQSRIGTDRHCGDGAEMMHGGCMTQPDLREWIWTVIERV